MLERIGFVTLRYWKGTTEYHKTKDTVHVKKVLGREGIESTMIYLNLEQAHFGLTNEKFTVSVAKTLTRPAN